MGTKEFTKQLGDLMDEAAKEGIMKGHMSFAQVIGTLEMAKMDMHNFAAQVAMQQKRQEQPLILVPDAAEIVGAKQ